jgi:hypothetical protein
MPDRSKGRGQTKCSLWSSRLVVGRGANDPTSEKFTVHKAMEEATPTQGCSASKEEKIFITLMINCEHLITLFYMFY